LIDIDNSDATIGKICFSFLRLQNVYWNNYLEQNKIEYGHLVWLALFTSNVFVCDGMCRRQTWSFPLYNVFSEVGFLTKSNTLVVVEPTKTRLK